MADVTDEQCPTQGGQCAEDLAVDDTLDTNKLQRSRSSSATRRHRAGKHSRQQGCHVGGSLDSVIPTDKNFNSPELAKSRKKVAKNSEFSLPPLVLTSNATLVVSRLQVYLLSC